MESIEPFEQAEKMLDELSEEINCSEMKQQSLIFTGQRMANLLNRVMDSKCAFYIPKKIRSEADELVLRWEKEFKKT